VASIWLLRGNAGAVMVRNCDGAATLLFCSLTKRISACIAGGSGSGFVSDFSRCVQGSLKSD
jgi:hypothetical protein